MTLLQNIQRALAVTNNVIQVRVLGAAIRFISNEPSTNATTNTTTTALHRALPPPASIEETASSAPLLQHRAANNHSPTMMRFPNIRRFLPKSLEERAEERAAALMEEDSDDDVDESDDDEGDYYEYMPVHKFAPPTEFQIRALFHLWKHGLASGDSEALSRRYAPNAVLVPLDLDAILDQTKQFPLAWNAHVTPITGIDAIRDHYDDFLATHRPTNIRVVTGQVTISLDDDGNSCWAQDNGIYEFQTPSGKTVQNRYTFIYGRDMRGRWKIANHTSSVLMNSDSNNSIAENTQAQSPKGTTTTTTTSPRSSPIPNRRPSQVDYLVGLLTRQQSVTQADLILLSMRKNQ